MIRGWESRLSSLALILSEVLRTTAFIGVREVGRDVFAIHLLPRIARFQEEREQVRAKELRKSFRSFQ
jgi:hypothetical protein